MQPIVFSEINFEKEL